MEILPYGDSALLINFEQRIDLQVHKKVMGLHARLQKADLPGITFLIPAYCSLVAGFQPEVVSFRELKRSIYTTNETGISETPRVSRSLLIPVCYEKTYAMDLGEVSKQTGLSPTDIIDLHVGTAFHVFMIGFLPGFAYMGPLPEALQCSRKSSPRTQVPAQSVGLAGRQTGVYPSTAPGGWQIIGKTPLPPFQGGKQQPFLFRAGDSVSFFAISSSEFDKIKQAVLSGTYNWELVYGQ